jgi:hypothetical protein
VLCRRLTTADLNTQQDAKSKRFVVSVLRDIHLLGAGNFERFDSYFHILLLKILLRNFVVPPIQFRVTSHKYLSG